MSDIPETIQDVAASAVGEVAESAEQVEHFIRSLQKVKIKFGLGGYVIGVATGAAVAWKLAYRKAELTYSRIADNEIAEMSEHYHAKVRSLEANREKGDLEDLVQERGYVSADEERPPMAVTPPEAVVEASSETVTKETTRPAPPVPVDPAPKPDEVDVTRRNIFHDPPEGAVIMDSWDYQKEKALRSPDIPYVIHYDERNEFEGYGEMTLTYYEGDDVLSNERDEVIAEGPERDNLVSERCLDRFGHGSNDPSIVYVRNDKLEMVFEIVKSPQAFAEEVHGFTHDSYSNIEKMRLRERAAIHDDG